jgi:hypothetical protein
MDNSKYIGSGKLPPAIKEDWIKSLRSGEFTQTTGRLRIHRLSDNTDHYCCIGVYSVRNSLPINPNGFPGVPYNDIEQNAYANLEQYIGRNSVNKLINLNDGGHDFKYIADYIELNY